jgi:succinate dehydrogenase / fumarate reductase iron-sulfur subunit
VSINTGSTVDGNAIPIGKKDADEAMDYASCIGCGACVAACPNAAAMLFTGAKVAHLVKLPQGQVERAGRVRNMVAQMDARASAAAPTTASAPRPARRRSPSTRS